MKGLNSILDRILKEAQTIRANEAKAAKAKAAKRKAKAQGKVGS